MWSDGDTVSHDVLSDLVSVIDRCLQTFQDLALRRRAWLRLLELLGHHVLPASSQSVEYHATDALLLAINPPTTEPCNNGFIIVPNRRTVQHPYIQFSQRRKNK